MKITTFPCKSPLTLYSLQILFKEFRGPHAHFLMDGGTVDTLFIHTEEGGLLFASLSTFSEESVMPDFSKKGKLCILNISGKVSCIHICRCQLICLPNYDLYRDMNGGKSFFRKYLAEHRRDRKDGFDAFIAMGGICNSDMLTQRFELLHKCIRICKFGWKHLGEITPAICKRSDHRLNVCRATCSCDDGVSAKRKSSCSYLIGIDQRSQGWVRKKLIEDDFQVFCPFPIMQKSLCHIRFQSIVAVMIDRRCDISLRSKMGSQPAQL